MNNLSVKYGSIAVAVGLFGLAIYQASTKDVAGAIQSVLGGLAALGVNLNATNHEQLNLKLEQKGMV